MGSGGKRSYSIREASGAGGYDGDCQTGLRRKIESIRPEILFFCCSLQPSVRQEPKPHSGWPEGKLLQTTKADNET